MLDELVSEVSTCQGLPMGEWINNGTPHTRTQWNTEMSEPDLHVSTGININGEWEK